MQRERRHDPYPLTWEIPVVVVVVVVLVLVLGVHIGRAFAVALSGEGWGWPARSDVFVALPGVLGGDAQAGLPGGQGIHTSSVLLRACIAIVEVFVVALSVVLVRTCLLRWGPWRVQGMATRAEAEQLLGVSRLRASRAVIRPDLCGDPKAKR